MKLTPKIASVAVALMALGGAAAGTAVASSASAAAPAAARAAQPEPTSPDHDAIQQGDQTRPDARTAGVRSENLKEPPESASESESGTASDGPGGHADPAGTVQYQFNGME
jgi:hypothetical protein